jgi:hypothetical protein
MRKLFVVISILVLAKTGYAQEGDNYLRYLEDKKYSIIHREDSIINDKEKHGYLNTISIEPVPLFISLGDIVETPSFKTFPTVFSMTYSRKLNYSTELTITSRLQFHSMGGENLLFDFSSKDPFWFYDEFAIRFGYRKFVHKKFYVEPQLSYTYGEFSNRWINYEQEEYHYFKDYLITRNFHAIGADLLWGVARSIHQVQINFYCGIGLNLKYIDETIKDFRVSGSASYGSSNQKTFPERNYYWLPKPAVFMGFKLGYNFNKTEFKIPNRKLQNRVKKIQDHNAKKRKIKSLTQDTTKYLNTISIEPIPFIPLLANAIIQNSSLAIISLTFSHQLNKKIELTVTPRLQYQSKTSNIDFPLLDNYKDPFWCYNEFSLRVGLRKRMYKALYLEPLVNYMYGEFSNREIIYDNPYHDYVMSRNFHAAGLGILAGFLQNIHHIQTNVYCGIGMNLKYINETIKQDKALYGVLADPSNFPERKYYFLPKLAIYAGFKIGYSFKKKVEKPENIGAL